MSARARVRDLLTPTLVSGHPPPGLTGRDWSTLVRQARAAGLLGRIAEFADSNWPVAALAHATAARAVTDAQVREIHREVGHLRVALSTLDAPIVLLKGAAYTMLDLPSSRGRVFSDIDLLVPRSVLGRAESLLSMAGWMTTSDNEYDQRYYREWAHELPPMEHVHRKTTIDVHHNLLPQTARIKPDAGRLFEDLVPVPGHQGVFALGPADMVLHSMTHLFINDDTSHALRDLSDIDLLLRHFAREGDFWQTLLARAVDLHLTRHCHYALRYTAEVLGTPVPALVLSAAARYAPPRPVGTVMHWVWKRVLAPPSSTAGVGGNSLARWLLLIRGHWLRMPPGLLLRHLAVKALRLHLRGKASSAEVQTTMREG